jgi:hypothetical protein
MDDCAAGCAEGEVGRDATAMIIERRARDPSIPSGQAGRSLGGRNTDFRIIPYQSSSRSWLRCKKKTPRIARGNYAEH